MAQTIIGVFDTADAAHAAQKKLAGRGIDPSALHIAVHPSAQRDAVETEETREGGMPAGIRDFFAELFGTEHSAEAGHHSETILRGGVVLAVDLPEEIPAEPIRQVLLDAGAVDVNERMGHWRPESPADYDPTQRPYEQYEPDYRKDFQIRYAARGGSYEDYAHAYRYGHNLAGDPRYQDWDWQSIEPEAQRDWESQYPESTWERFKLAIQHGWERVTGGH